MLDNVCYVNFPCKSAVFSLHNACAEARGVDEASTA